MKGAEQVLAAAKKKGWAECRRGWTCPQHSKAAPPKVSEKPGDEQPQQ